MVIITVGINLAKNVLAAYSLNDTANSPIKLTGLFAFPYSSRA